MDLVYRLSDLLQSSLASIEILPGGYKDWESIDVPADSPKPSPGFPFILVEGNLGIPKKVLHSLYTTAISSPWRTAGGREADAVSTTIILLNPAHQTAFNTRKRLIRDGYLDPGRELILTELISRGSPECSKQSIMWSHRRWCFEQVYGTTGPATAGPSLQGWATSEEVRVLPKMTPEAIHHELDIIHRTSEIYPRNYHSWTYFHFLMEVCYTSVYLSDDFDSRREFFGIMTGERLHLTRWVEQHVTDYSAVHQLCQLQRRLDHLRGTPIEHEIFELPDPLALVDHAVSLVLAFPSHESLWMYLRVALAISTEQKRAKVLDDINSGRFPASVHRHRLLNWFTKERAQKESLR